MIASEIPWTKLTNGYREFDDPRSLIARFRKRKSLTTCWDEVWETMHHQGDVGTASYALVPPIVDVYAKRARGWEVYSYVAKLEACREERRNPDMPDWLADDYARALVRLREMAFEDLRQKRGAGMLVCIFAFLAACCRSLGLSVAVHDLDMNEHSMESLERYGESLNDLD